MEDTNECRIKFNEILTGAFETITSGKATPLSKMSKRFYFETLKNYSLETIRKAFNQICATRVYHTMPNPAEIIEAIKGKSVSIEDRALIEATRVLKAISRYGSYQSVVFDNTTTQAVISTGFGGWANMCRDLMESEKKWFLKDFVKIFVAYTAQNITRAGVLPGIIERENGNAGYVDDIPEPRLIGDRNKCLQIAGQEPQDILSGPIDPGVKLLTEKIINEA